MAEQPTPPAWEIVGQREDFQPGPTGTFVQGVVVTFRTAAGAIGSVFVPSDQYTVERVRSIVSERAATMATIHGLVG